jgi:hypothetical protein
MSKDMATHCAHGTKINDPCVDCIHEDQLHREREARKTAEKFYLDADHFSAILLTQVSHLQAQLRTANETHRNFVNWFNVQKEEAGISTEDNGHGSWIVNDRALKAEIRAMGAEAQVAQLQAQLKRIEEYDDGQYAWLVKQ